MTSRRAFLSSGLAVAAGAALTGYTSWARAAVASTPALATAGTAEPLVMIVRHAEKPVGIGTPRGVDQDGTEDDQSLTTRGWTRAGTVVTLFAPVTPEGPLTPRVGLARPAAIYAASPEGGASKRPFQTVTPLARRLAVSIDTSYRKGQEGALASALRNATGPTLVAWEHDAIPTIVAGLGRVDPAPPAAWPHDRFDLIWCLARTHGDGWTFAQVPQLLLDGDSSQVA